MAMGTETNIRQLHLADIPTLDLGPKDKGKGSQRFRPFFSKAIQFLSRHQRKTWLSMQPPSLLLSSIVVIGSITSSCRNNEGMIPEYSNHPIVSGSDDFDHSLIDLSDTQIRAIGLVKINTNTNIVKRCTGVLVKPDKVLTAAHCVTIDPQEEYEISSIDFIGGRADFYEHEQGDYMSRVSSVYVHPDYDPINSSSENDLAVLDLEDPAPEQDVTPLKVNQALDTTPPSKIQAVGYGLTDPKQLENSKRQWLVMDVLNFGDFFFTTSAKPGVQGICLGDSGGPALAKKGDETIVWGIASKGDLSCVGIAYYTGTAGSWAFLGEHLCNSIKADCGGPYVVGEGDVITLNGDRSCLAERLGWDLDMDGSTDHWGEHTEFSAKDLDGPCQVDVELMAWELGKDTFSDKCSVKIAVENRPPEIQKVNVVGELIQGETVTLEVQARDPCPTDELTYEFYWGDKFNSRTRTQEPFAEHTYTKAGKMLVRVHVIDDDGGKGIRMLELNVIPRQEDESQFESTDSPGVEINSDAGDTPLSEELDSIEFDLNEEKQSNDFSEDSEIFPETIDEQTFFEEQDEYDAFEIQEEDTRNQIRRNNDAGIGCGCRNYPDEVQKNSIQIFMVTFMPLFLLYRFTRSRFRP